MNQIVHKSDNYILLYSEVASISKHNATPRYEEYNQHTIIITLKSGTTDVLISKTEEENNKTFDSLVDGLMKQLGIANPAPV